MAVVKILNKQRLDKLLSKLTMRIGRKPTQQEVVDLCVEIAEENFETLVGRINQLPILDDKKYQKICSISDDLEDVPWKPLTKSLFKAPLYAMNETSTMISSAIKLRRLNNGVLITALFVAESFFSCFCFLLIWILNIRSRRIWSESSNVN